MKSKVLGIVSGAGVAVERMARGKRVRVDPAAVRSVLVLEYRLPLGCCVHLTPAYEAIKRGRPELTLTVATLGLGAALLRRNGWIDHVIETPDPLRNPVRAARMVRGELKRRGVRPDCTLTGASDGRTLIGLMGLFVGGGWRGGFTETKTLYQQPLVYDLGRSLIANNVRLAELAGCPYGVYEPSVYFSSAEVEAARGLAREANPEGKPLLVMVTRTSGGQRTGWHEDRFVAVARYAVERLGCAVAFVGTAGDGTAIEGLRAATGGLGTSLAGRTTVTELAALLAMSDLVFSLDTGSMHIGRAAGVPMVVIGPSWQKPLEWLPLGLEQVRILRGADRDDIPEGYQLDELEPEDVNRALTELMERYPPSAESREARVLRGLSEVDHRQWVATTSL